MRPVCFMLIASHVSCVQPISSSPSVYFFLSAHNLLYHFPRQRFLGGHLQCFHTAPIKRLALFSFTKGTYGLPVRLVIACCRHPTTNNTMIGTMHYFPALSLELYTMLLNVWFVSFVHTQRRRRCHMPYVWSFAFVHATRVYISYLLC